MSRLPARAVLVLGCALLGLGGCCRTGPRTVEPPACRATVRLADLGALARAMRARARAHEPAVTVELVSLASEVGGRLVGLDHRLKTLSSIEGKIVREQAKRPGTRAESVELQDVLRYTLLVEDEPPGHYDEAVRGVLRALEEAGDTVVQVKNYWPRGDSYSGTNTVLRTADGFAWELQFHTPASWATKRATHDDYETMRKPRTPRSEKRRLFERMSRLWEKVKIPEGVLRPHSLHAQERIVTIPLP